MKPSAVSFNVTTSCAMITGAWPGSPAEKDQTHHAGLAKAQGVTGLALAARQRLDTGADDLRQDGAVVGDEGDDDGPVGREADADDRQTVIEQEHEDQHRDGAEELHDPADRDANPGVVGQAPDREDEPEHQSADRRGGERRQRGECGLAEAHPDGV